MKHKPRRSPVKTLEQFVEEWNATYSMPSKDFWHTDTTITNVYTDEPNCSVTFTVETETQKRVRRMKKRRDKEVADCISAWEAAGCPTVNALAGIYWYDTRDDRTLDDCREKQNLISFGHSG